MKRIAELQDALEAAQRTARRQSAPLYRVMTRGTKEKENGNLQSFVANKVISQRLTRRLTPRLWPPDPEALAPVVDIV
jgi:hypothetical protein